jgi:hypothetical protein
MSWCVEGVSWGVDEYIWVVDSWWWRSVEVLRTLGVVVVQAADELAKEGISVEVSADLEGLMAWSSWRNVERSMAEELAEEQVW